MSLKNAIGGIALISGTAIGAGILALPIATAHLGFLQTVGMYFICWFFMTLSSLYLLEANLYVTPGANLITMAQSTLGRTGKYFTWATYLMLLYCLLAVYLTGSAAWISYGATQIHFALSPLLSALIATGFTIVVIFLGTTVTDWINRFLMIALISAFFTLLFTSIPTIESQNLLFQPKIIDVKALPLIITAFGSAIVIPSITAYLHGKPRQLLHVVFIGCLIPFIVYVLWEFMIAGTIPLEGDYSLLQIQRHEMAPIENTALRSLVTDVPLALQQHLQKPWVTIAATYFSILVILTSLLGVCLSLFDFLADGLKIKKTHHGRILLTFLTFCPPLFFVLFYPLGFSILLSFAGFFVAVLLGILPSLMVWFGRYHHGFKSRIHIPGGKIFIVFSLAFFIGVMGIETFNQMTQAKARQLKPNAESPVE